MKFLLKNKSSIIASGLGIGLIPIAPGTFASLFGLLLFIFIPLESNSFFHLIIIFLLLILGVWSSNNLSTPEDLDPSRVVIDEIVGIWISCLFLPKNSIWIIFAFVLFRFFDIYKPMPIDYFEKKYQNTFGVIFDDIIAAGYALLAIYIINIII